MLQTVQVMSVISTPCDDNLLHLSSLTHTLYYFAANLIPFIVSREAHSLASLRCHSAHSLFLQPLNYVDMVLMPLRVCITYKFIHLSKKYIPSMYVIVYLSSNKMHIRLTTSVPVFQYTYTLADHHNTVPIHELDWLLIKCRQNILVYFVPINFATTHLWTMSYFHTLTGQKPTRTT